MLKRVARWATWTVALGLSCLGCQVRGVIGSNETAASGPSDATSGSAPGTTSGDTTTSVTTRVTSESTTVMGSGSTEAPEDDEDSGKDPIFDVQAMDVPAVCAPPTMPSCDDGETWWSTVGLGCSEDGEGTFEANTLGGALAIHKGGLGAGHFAPREGERMLILSTGEASELALAPAELLSKHPDCDLLICPSSDLSGARQTLLPMPISPHAVSESRTCDEDPTLIGKGDCSNSLAEHWARGDGALDYSELRMRLEVPPNTDAFSYDFAFFSSEYPLFIDHNSEIYNDMYVAWLESENWTGNISFDENMNPITVHSVLLDHRTASDVCPECKAPELEGFTMEQHAGTKWLTTVAPVVPGEEIELIFAIFDLSDPQFDSFVLLDNFEWTCSDGPPVTVAG